MADLGYRSIEVLVTNDTRGNLTVEEVSAGANCSWVTGETASQGEAFSQYVSVQWGVKTNDVNASVSGQVQLTGQGSFPISITFVNNENGQTTCHVGSNNAVKGIVNQQGTGPQNHTTFTVQLIPA